MSMTAKEIQGCAAFLHHVMCCGALSEPLKRMIGKAIDGLDELGDARAALALKQQKITELEARLRQAAPEPAMETVAVDAGALAELREAMTKLRMLPESAISRPAGSVARERVMEAARRLLAGD